MAKSKTKFYCSECGNEFSKWSGQCPSCKAWNTMVEAPAASTIKTNIGKSGSLTNIKPVKISNISLTADERILTGIKEFDRVLGGGIVRGSLVLLGGDPGIGKSTLLMQTCMKLSHNNEKVLYVSGEESPRQIKMRAMRLGNVSDELLLLCNNDLEAITEVIGQIQPDVVIIDSIQTMSNQDSFSSGSISQIKEATSIILKIAKEMNIAFFIVGHVTKDGAVAGPKVLEHMVDTVLYFEGDKNASYRILRSVKNRFGPANEIGVFEMVNKGLKEVLNPSEYMISGRAQNASGCTITCSLEGSRPILMEIQALVCDSVFQIPRRTATGVDYNRVNMLMAVLEKRVGVRLLGSDAYVNVTGGFKINEPAIDLGIVTAIVSAYRNRPVDSDVIVFGEVGLSGEVRGVSRAAVRIAEAEKLGFKTIIVPKVNLKGLEEYKNIKVVGVSNIEEAIKII